MSEGLSLAAITPTDFISRMVMAVRFWGAILPAITPTDFISGIDPFNSNPVYEEKRQEYINEGTYQLNKYLNNSFFNEDYNDKYVLSNREKIDYISQKFNDSYFLQPNTINRINDLMNEEELNEENIDINIYSFNALYKLLSDITLENLSIGIDNEGNATILQDKGRRYFFAKIKDENEVLYNILKEDYPKTDLLTTDTLSKFKKSLNDYGFINYAYS